MDLDLLGLVLRWAHILPAIVAAGGTIFMRLALVPATSVLSEEQRLALQADVRSRWLMPLMISLGLLLVSGLINFIRTSQNYDLSAAPYYHIMFGFKFLIALAIMWIASALVGRSKATESMRANAKYWLTVNVWLVVVLVLISGLLRMAPKTPKTDIKAPAATTAPAESS